MILPQTFIRRLIGQCERFNYWTVGYMLYRVNFEIFGTLAKAAYIIFSCKFSSIYADCQRDTLVKVINLARVVAWKRVFETWLVGLRQRKCTGHMYCDERLGTSHVPELFLNHDREGDNWGHRSVCASSWKILHVYLDIFTTYLTHARSVLLRCVLLCIERRKQWVLWK